MSPQRERRSHTRIEARSPTAVELYSAESRWVPVGMLVDASTTGLKIKLPDSIQLPERKAYKLRLAGYLELPEVRLVRTCDLENGGSEACFTTMFDQRLLERIFPSIASATAAQLKIEDAA